jgi:hypothetical protein
LWEVSTWFDQHPIGPKFVQESVADLISVLDVVGSTFSAY